MFAIAFLFVRVLCDCFKSRPRLEAEVLVRRHQLNALQQRAPHRLCLTWIDRALFVSLSVPKTPSIGFAIAGESEHDCWMFTIAFLFVRVLCNCFKSRRRLEAEVLVLRHQLNVLQQRAPHRLYLTWIDRALFVWLYRGYPRILDAITILRPETIVRWHRKGFAAFWRWKSALSVVDRRSTKRCATLSEE